MRKEKVTEEANEANVQYVWGWFLAPPKTEDFLPLYTPSRKLRYEGQIKPPGLFHLLLLEMRHGNRKT